VGATNGIMLPIRPFVTIIFWKRMNRSGCKLTSGLRGKEMKRSTFGSKGQSHTTLKLDLETWRRHHSRPVRRIKSASLLLHRGLTLYGHIKAAEQQIIIQQYGEWYTGRWWVGCYIFGTARRGMGGLRPHPRPWSPSRCTKCNRPAINGQLCIPSSFHSMWHYNCFCNLKG